MINLYHIDYDVDELTYYLNLAINFLIGSDDSIVNVKVTELQEILIKLELHRFTISEIGLLCGALECIKLNGAKFLSKRMELQLHGQF